MLDGSCLVDCPKVSNIYALSNQQRSSAIPGGKSRRHIETQRQHHGEMGKDRYKCRRMRQWWCVAFSEDHLLNAAEDCSEGHTERDQEKRSCPGMFSHGGGENEKLTRKHAKRRHAEYGKRSQREPPANRRADAHKAVDTIHLLRAGRL